jgi:predicted RNA-binding Zn-ribbon protein involved in translation (DUF1610 family)
MKNSELLSATHSGLELIEKRRRYVLRCLVQHNPCPNCGQMLNFFDGAGIDIDDWYDKAGVTPCRCTACGRTLQYVVPRLVLGGNGGWHWDLAPIGP